MDLQNEEMAGCGNMSRSSRRERPKFHESNCAIHKNEFVDKIDEQSLLKTHNLDCCAGDAETA
jgi:hypothetical protein